MNKQQIKFIKDMVEELRWFAGGGEPDILEGGLCVWISSSMGFRGLSQANFYGFRDSSSPLDVWLRQVFASWQYYSGDVIWPVPGRPPLVQNYWVDEYGELRRNLCDYLADCLEEFLETI